MRAYLTGFSIERGCKSFSYSFFYVLYYAFSRNWTEASLCHVPVRGFHRGSNSWLEGDALHITQWHTKRESCIWDPYHIGPIGSHNTFQLKIKNKPLCPSRFWANFDFCPPKWWKNVIVWQTFMSRPPPLIKIIVFKLWNVYFLLEEA